MDNTILTALITVSGGLVAAGLTFFFTKRYELMREWREKKLDHYRELLSALSDLAVSGTDKDKANMRFALAVNTISLVAPQYIVTALMNFHDEVKFSNKNRSPEKHDELLVELLLAIRKDIKLTEKDDPKTFNFHLIGSAPQ